MAISEELEQLLKNLKLTRLLALVERELERAEKEGPSYADFFARLLREEYHEQQGRYLQHRLRRSRRPERWALESFPWQRQPAVRRAQIEQLAELDFIPRAANLVFIGKAGVGKTGLASAILLKALQAGYRGLFLKAQDLFDEMYRSLADHSSRRLLNHLARLDVVLIDKMGDLNLRPEQSNIFFKLMEERSRRTSTIITTNLDYDDWYTFLGQKDMVGALLDRRRHHCQTIRIDGPSRRDPDRPVDPLPPSSPKPRSKPGPGA